MQSLWVDKAYISLNKSGEEVCGDHVEVSMDKDRQTTMVLADGLGSGVKANILSTMTAKILCTMVSQNMPMEECLHTMISTLPVCSERNIAYCTFSVLSVKDCSRIHIVQYDNPPVIFLRHGKNLDYYKDERILQSQVIYESTLPLQEDDVIVAVSDGAEFAGTERTFNYNWSRDDIIKYLEEIYNPSLSSNLIASMLTDRCLKLYGGKPSDDTTVAVIKIKKKSVVNLFFGPPAQEENDMKSVALFNAKEGIKILCGGTTSQIFSKHLGKELKSLHTATGDQEIPPASQMDGFDLVTEGLFTMTKVLENLRYNQSSLDMAVIWKVSDDAASEITHILLDEATNINFYVGKAVNPAHDDHKGKTPYHVKKIIVEEMSKILESMGKTVNISYL